LAVSPQGHIKGRKGKNLLAPKEWGLSSLPYACSPKMGRGIVVREPELTNKLEKRSHWGEKKRVPVSRAISVTLIEKNGLE